MDEPDEAAQARLAEIERAVNEALTGVETRSVVDEPYLVAWIRQRIEESLDVKVHDMIVDATDPYRIKVQAACTPKELKVQISIGSYQERPAPPVLPHTDGSGLNPEQ